MEEQAAEDMQRQYPHLDPEMVENLLEVKATSKQWQSADKAAKKSIDKLLINYQTDFPQCFTMVIGESGSGKSATANTLMGRKWCEESSAAQSVTSNVVSKIVEIEGFQVIVHDTPGSWQTKDGSTQVDCYIITINLASPRFSNETLQHIRNLKGSYGRRIIASGQFVVVLTHPDSALRGRKLSEYLQEIEGDPLHDFLTKDARGRVLAVNNMAPTEYQRRRHQLALYTRILYTMDKEQQRVSEATNTSAPEAPLRKLDLF